MISKSLKWAEELKNEYSKIAKENMSKGGKGCPNEQTLNTRELVAKDLDIGSEVENVPLPLGQVRDRIAQDLDMGSGRNDISSTLTESSKIDCKGESNLWQKFARGRNWGNKANLSTLTTPIEKIKTREQNKKDNPIREWRCKYLHIRTRTFAISSLVLTFCSFGQRELPLDNVVQGW